MQTITMQNDSKFHQQFIQVYVDCVKQIATTSEREDFEILVSKCDNNQLDYQAIIQHFSTGNSDDMNFGEDGEWEPFGEEASLCNAWDDISSVQKEILECIKMLIMLSNLCLNSADGSGVGVGLSKTVEPKPISSFKKKRGNKKKRRKMKKKKEKEKEKEKGVESLNSIDNVKDVFKGTSGEGVMSDMIDSIVNELHEPSTTTSDVKMSKQEAKQMEMLGGMLNISPDQMKGVFGVAKKISGDFSEKLNSDEINSNELLEAAQNLLKNMM